MAERDCSLQLQEQVQRQLQSGAGEGLDIAGGASRTGFNLAVGENPLSLAEHAGVIDYQPDELMLKVRSGTSLASLEKLLAAEGQGFAADIPRPGAGSTIGGAVATGWDGPARVFGLSLRDVVIGCRMLNGRGEIVNFGGQVMKNVAGYDLSRLQVGALGTLGVLLDVTLRLWPQPEYSLTRSFVASVDDLPQWWQKTRLLRPLISGACHCGDRLYLRLSGRRAAVVPLLDSLGGEDSDFDWCAVRDLRHRFFSAEQLACVYLPRAMPFEPRSGTAMVDWEGARVWVADGDHGALQRQAAELGGFVRILRGRVLAAAGGGEDWHRRIKRAFDPEGLFNRDLYRTHFGGAEV
ncbi:FAD-binding protein [Microbulbifer halophilus]|uniref:FAD-binding protein n=1 Tax=Microbulbifer halophilus TaxID=453963 RepID=A0ABW5EIT7_9GAMM|nr:FAD-binding protein [Microbulbifer halophilus]MCW8126981.1 FAD-binding protein [Microbulbifer halophilus]